MKKTICLVTNWYPTKDNPYAGAFFKEQAFSVSDDFDFIIFRYKEHLRKLPWKRNSAAIVNKEKNTIEYDVDVYVPVYLYFSDVVHNMVVKITRKNMVDGIGKYVSPRRHAYTRKHIVNIFKSVINMIPDCFYCVDAQSEAFWLQCLAEHFDRPYVVGEHAPVPWPGSLIKDIDKYAIEKADLFLAISNDKIRQMLLQNIKLPKTVYIGNLIDEEKLETTNKTADHVKTFIIIAANSFYKNYDLFIKMMSLLKKIANKPFKVMIVGYAANKGYSKNVEEFENKIRQSDFADVTQMIPEVPHEQIGQVLGQADAFVMTSIQEGQPVSAMEAACCGLPVFSTRCGGIEDYVTDDIGRIYAVTDYEGMANGLNDYLEGKITFDSEYIRSQMVAKFGKEAFRKNFKETFNKVIKNA